MRKKTFGTMNGAIAAASYGTNPLFALPMFMAGIGVNSVLFYRYAFAVIIYGLYLKLIKKISLKITSKQFIPMCILAVFFSLSSLTLFDAFNYIEAGIACTILFIYPVLVAIIMAMFFKERITKTVVTAIFLTSAGIALLYNGKSGASLNMTGVGMVLLSALLYALYIVGVKKIKPIKKLKPSVLSFYVMLIGLVVYIVNLKFCTNLQILSTPKLWFYAIGLAILPTIISLETITLSIKLVGSTKTAILGALEPITAIFFGVLVFHEHLSTRIMLGVAMILFGVLLIVITKKHTKSQAISLEAPTQNQ